MKINFAQKCGIIMLMVISVWGCKKQPIVFATDSGVNITGYLDSEPDQFSEFRKILEITGNAGFLNAYGAYTLFLPNNTAVKNYLTEESKTSVEQLDVQTLKDLVRFHLIEDTISTSNFNDGKLRTLTMFGQYLITGASFSNGITSIRINRQANVVKPNIVTGNGIIHVIDHMLIPAKLTIAQMVENNPKYSIFTQALKATGMYDFLNVLPANNSGKRYTLLAETDSTLKAAGYSTYSALKARFSKTGNPSNVNDSLRIFVEYHILSGSKYLADIISTNSHVTFAPAEVITSKLTGTSVLINDDDFNGKHETGITLNRSSSDNSATNGVVHATGPYTVGSVTSTGHLAIKVRVPLRIDWDVADFPELRALPAFFRRASTDFPAPVSLKTITSPATNTKLYYAYSSANRTIYGDYLAVNLGAPNRAAKFNFTTPLLVKGKYKVWICYAYYIKSTSQKSIVSQVSIDGTPLQRTWDEVARRPSTGSEAELESQGWKQYINGYTSTSFNGRLLGTVDLPSTKTYDMEFLWVSGASGETRIDVIQFIPVDQNQVHPMINTDGTLEY